jgi:uncharacterized protein (DUF302 family)
MKLRIITVVCFLIIVLSSFAQKESYYMSKVLDVNYEEVIVKLEEVVKEQGFGIVNKMPIHESLNSKISDINMKPYIVVGVCNANIAWESIQHESNIGVFMPCKVIVKYLDETKTEVVFVKPSVTMSVIDNPEIQKTADEVTKSLEKILNSL